MARVLLLLPSATYRAPDFLAAAARLGAEVVVASDVRQTMAATMGDRAITLDLEDVPAAVETVVALHGRTPLDAVVAVDDGGVLVAAAAAARLGLRHSPPEAVARTRDKLAMRAALDAAGVAQPRWRPYSTADDAFVVGYPCVLKPAGLAASRGVIRVDAPGEVEATAARIQAIAPGHPLLVEAFVPGREVAVEGIVRGGQLEVLAIFDKPDPLDGPYFEETIYVTPSRLPEERQAAIARLVADAAGALGLTEGPVHAEARVDDVAITILEVAARTIGGLCARTLRFGLGMSLEEVVLRHALGRRVDATGRERAAAGVMMLPISEGGRLVEVGGRDAALAVPGIVGLEITVPLGREVVPLPEGDRYLGFLFARAESPAAVEAALRAAHAALDVRIDPAVVRA